MEKDVIARQCLCCDQETDNPRFCSRSCSARYNNKLHPKRSVEGKCLDCKMPISSTRKRCKPCVHRKSDGLKNVRRKICGLCGTSKSRKEFSRNIAAATGLCSYCKSCARHYFGSWLANDPDRRLRKHRWKRKRVAENKILFVEYLASHACIDCGNSDFRVLEFDHVRGEKIMGVSAMLRRGIAWEVIEEEIRKCDVRCANCHRIVTSMRGNWWQLEFADESETA